MYGFNSRKNKQIKRRNVKAFLFGMIIKEVIINYLESTLDKLNNMYIVIIFYQFKDVKQGV